MSANDGPSEAAVQERTDALWAYCPDVPREVVQNVVEGIFLAGAEIHDWQLPDLGALVYKLHGLPPTNDDPTVTYGSY